MSDTLPQEPTTQTAQRLVLKDNNCATNDPCVICGARCDPGVGPELFLEGTWALACDECGRKYEPTLQAVKDLWYHAENSVHEGSSF